MLQSLLDKIKYEHIHYAEVDDTKGKREIEEWSTRLKPLEKEILDCEEGSITIMKSGNIFTDSFPEPLATKMRNLITGKN